MLLLSSPSLEFIARNLDKSYNLIVKIEKLHEWQVSISEAMEIQRRLAAQVSRNSDVINPRFIAGVDISAERARGAATGAVVVVSYPELKIMEIEIMEGELSFPYVPGLLSFRESPIILSACERLAVKPDLFLVDGQGIAHPRRMGFASHLGLFLNTPTIGCAKSLLCGTNEMLGIEPGSYTGIFDKGEVIGAALRTKRGMNPIYVSIGHRISLQSAIHWALECCRGYRIPEPTRLAHLAAGGNHKLEKAASISETDRQGRLFS